MRGFWPLSSPGQAFAIRPHSSPGQAFAMPHSSPGQAFAMEFKVAEFEVADKPQHVQHFADAAGVRPAE